MDKIEDALQKAVDLQTKIIEGQHDTNDNIGDIVKCLEEYNTRLEIAEKCIEGFKACSTTQVKNVDYLMNMTAKNFRNLYIFSIAVGSIALIDSVYILFQWFGS